MPPSSQMSKSTDHIAGSCWKVDRGTYMFELACEIAGIESISSMEPSSFERIMLILLLLCHTNFSNV